MPSQRSPREAARAVGQTKAAGWQIGVRRTLPASAAELWERLVSADGARHWLGELSEPLGPEAAYRLADGTVGAVRVWRPGAQLRLTRQAPGAERSSILQLRLVPAARGTTIAWHEEHLPDAGAREARRAVFEATLEALATPSSP